MQIRVVCPVCRDTKYDDGIKKLRNTEDYRDTQEFKVIRCSKCGLKRIYPILSKENIIEFYSSQYYGREHARFRKWIEPFIYFSRIKQAKEVVSFKKNKGRILDIGCGRGWFLSTCRDLGWEVYGTEISEDAAKFAIEERKLKVFTKDITECNFPADYFDIITTMHTFEHLSNPSEVLDEINRILKKNGFLILTTPNIDSPVAKLTKNSWFPLDIPHHYYHYSIKTLRKLLNIKGFKVIKMGYGSLEYDFFSILQSCLNLLCSKHSFLYNLLRNKYAIKIPAIEYFYNKSLTLLFTPVFGILSFFILLFEKAGKCSGTVKVWAIR